MNFFHSSLQMIPLRLVSTESKSFLQGLDSPFSFMIFSCFLMQDCTSLQQTPSFPSVLQTSMKWSLTLTTSLGLNLAVVREKRQARLTRRINLNMILLRFQLKVSARTEVFIGGERRSGVTNHGLSRCHAFTISYYQTLAVESHPVCSCAIFQQF